MKVRTKSEGELSVIFFTFFTYKGLKKFHHFEFRSVVTINLMSLCILTFINLCLFVLA